MRTLKTTYVTSAVLEMIPEAAIDHLWMLVAERPETRMQGFVLERTWMSSGWVQDISHTDYMDFYEFHRLPGFEPVEAVVTVTRASDGYCMFLEDIR